MTVKWSGWRYLEARFVTILTIRFKGALVPAWPADRSPTRTGPVEADGAVDAQNAPTAPWKTLLVFHELPQGFPHQITHDKPRKSPESYWETRIDPMSDASDHLSQLADVAGIVACQQEVTDRIVQCGHFLVWSQFLQRVSDEVGNVLSTFGEGRQLEGPGCNPMVQIASESTFLDLSQEISVGGAHKSKRRRLPRVAPDSLVGAFLYDTEQLRLQGQRELADFIQKQGTSTGKGKRAISGGERVGERATLVSEELAARELRYDRRAVQHDELVLVLPRIEGMDQARDEFLSGAAFSREQHRTIRETRHLDHLT